MADVKIGGEPAKESLAAAEDFTFTMADGSIVVCGKPRGVLKLRLRDLLPTKELRDDPEVVGIATAFLSIRTIDGAPVWLQNYNHFEGLINRFGSDEAVDEFMEKFNRMVNPKMMETIDAAVKEAREKKIKPADLQDYVAQRILEQTDEERDRLKN